jgi:hypothetical protein
MRPLNHCEILMASEFENHKARSLAFVIFETPEGQPYILAIASILQGR